MVRLIIGWSGLGGEVLFGSEEVTVAKRSGNPTPTPTSTAPKVPAQRLL